MIAMAGQLLPWLAGLLLPALLLERESGRIPLLAGAEFLIGAVMVYVGLHWAGIAPLLLLAVLSVFALGSVVLLWHQAGRGGMLCVMTPTPVSKNIWFWLLLALIFGHLLFSLFDLLQRPLFPWDAWTTWTYRAKAWYLAGGVKEVVSPLLFWEGVPGQVYTISAFGYPELSSIYQCWSALTLGEWNDSWVAFPWLLLGIAIVFGLYGLGRRLGFSSALSLLLGYLFISLPMVGIHITLAGYSDLWMAGYVGLGFAMILVGQVRTSWRELALGLLFCTVTVLLKKEELYGLCWRSGWSGYISRSVVVECAAGRCGCGRRGAWSLQSSDVGWSDYRTGGCYCRQWALCSYS